LCSVVCREGVAAYVTKWSFVHVSPRYVDLNNMAV